MGKWKCWVLFRGSVTSTRLATPPFRAGNGHLFKSESCLLKESFKRAININSVINNAAFHSLSIWKQPRNRPPFSFTHPWSCWGGRRGKFLSGAWGGSCFFSSCLKATFPSFEKYIWRVLICISDATLKWAVESVRRGLTRLAQYLDRAREVGLPQLRDILDLSYFSAFKNEVGAVYMFLRKNENTNQQLMNT